MTWFSNLPSLIKIKFLLALVALSLLPGKNHYYLLNLADSKPLVRQVNYQFPPLSDYPVNQTQVPAPFLSSRSALVIDADTKTVLFEKNPDFKLLPASVTKIMTGLIVLESYPLDEIITITTVGVTGQGMKLELGERITIENLLYGLLVQSGNDAAAVLAQHHPDGEDGFIQAMNQKAQSFNLENTQFQNATGLDAYGHYTTVHDLGLLAAQAMQNPVFAKMVSISGITVSDVDNTVFHELETINQLLGKVSGLSGIKTGWTELAGECLVTYTTRDGRTIITVVLGSLDRFGESSQLIDWAFTNHQWQGPPATRS